jgi:hypothetical protein
MASRISNTLEITPTGAAETLVALRIAHLACLVQPRKAHSSALIQYFNQ